MSRRSFIILCCLLLLFIFTVKFSAASADFRVNEKGTRLTLGERMSEVSLALENNAGRSFRARITLELVDPRNVVYAASERTGNISQGASTILIQMGIPFNGDAAIEQDEFLWYRLRYRIKPESEGSAAALPAIEGIISLSEITPDIFELRVSSSEFAREAMRYRVRARTLHPLTQLPVADVEVEATITIETDAPDDLTLKTSGRTERDGYAVLEFDLPPGIKENNLDVEVTARRGGIVQKAEEDIQLDSAPRILINTDKPLYQPGQTMHTRALIFSPSRRTLADADATLKIKDPEGSTVFRTTLKSSRFGVVSADWSIPESTRLGNYTLEISIDDFENSEALHQVKISRYDLPNFSVTVKPDQTYYLPGRNAEVEVRADYLFGKPVTRGRVRVVRETEREWNYREQKWESKEEESYEGETDGEGRFIARVNLKKAHDRLKDRDYERFEDVTYAAYFTDATTGRTEQRRFDLRVTREAIHVYVIADYYQSLRLPLQFYLTTFYADGTPAQCEVVMRRFFEDKDAAAKSVRVNAALRTTGTNRYGVLKVSDLVIPVLEEEKDKDGDAGPSVSFSVRDREGRTGHHTESFSLRNRPAIRVETDKTLYRAGEPVRATILSSEPEANVVVDVVRDWRVIRSEIVSLHEGRAVITVPYSPDHSDELMISAYTDFDTENRTGGQRTVLYPSERDLKLDVRPTQTTYRPGEEASITLSVRTPEGRAAESALGIVVFDKAVEERARTDQEFGNGSYGFYGSYRGLWGGGEYQLAGVNRQDLDRLNLSNPIPEGLELLAEVMLNQGRNNYYYAPQIYGGERYETSQTELFASLINKQFDPLKMTLAARYYFFGDYPTDDASLRRTLAPHSIDFDSLRDPWGVQYRADFSVEHGDDVLTILTAGADKQFGTTDDFTVARVTRPYFRPVGESIDLVIKEYHERTGGFIRDESTLRNELLLKGIDLESLRDRWGQPYRILFGVSGTNFTLMVESGGPNGRFETARDKAPDDFQIWTGKIDYFAETRVSLDVLLDNHFTKTGQFPTNVSELRKALREAGIDLENLRDPWNRSYYAAFRNEARYADRTDIQNRARYGETARQNIVVTPVTLRVLYATLRSAGEDGKEGTTDDFNVADFSATVEEQRALDATPKPVNIRTTFRGATGAISGTLRDSAGAVVPGFTVKATRKSTSEVFEDRTNDDGHYILRNLPAGLYEVRVDAQTGFASTAITDVPVRSRVITKIDITLQVAATSEMVTVTSGVSNAFYTTDAQLSVSSGRGVSVTFKADTSTPRLREYFPETLLWQPELQTDASGRAQLKFKLADNITTWKLSIIGSTVDGEIGTAVEEIRAFQPFFVEHDPPRILTEGDEIALPVVLRNYLESSQSVGLEIKPESWFTLLGPAEKRAEVSANESARETFNFRATASIKDGKQRITATGTEASDAIERVVTVHPDGEEMSMSATEIFSDSTTLEANFPEDVIKGSARSELKIYPNLMAHVIESIEGIMQRPYGCGEQTISSTYPSLLLLRAYKGKKDPPAVALKARRYVRAGYERLLNYRSQSGGFSYWGRGEADLALTAYALRFLNDAGELIDVDEEVLKGAREWLMKKQRADGSWPALDYQGKEDTRRTALVTAYVARVLAASEKKEARARSASNNAPSAPSAATKNALAYLARRVDEWNEPYLLASYVLAASDANDTASAGRIAARLQALARDENGASYWSLETNTPFYGWGLAGRVETTALVVQALARVSQTDAAIDRGLLFLLRQKDRYGVWYSTQATINVLDALVALVPKSGADAQGSQTGAARNGEAGPAEIFVNGERIKSVEMPPADEPASPIIVQISEFLSTSRNRIEIRRSTGHGAHAAVQIVSTYYLPWPKALALAQAEGPKALRLSVSYDRTDTLAGSEVTCKVLAERVGFSGYGMLLAEVGLPPGADVDRASLERAMKESGWSFSQYDVLPDRLIVYLWPHAGGTGFEFKFRPRFGLKAQTAPSVLYDYYNPEARTIVAPTKFIVREGN